MSGFEQNLQTGTLQQQTAVLNAQQQLGLELLALPLAGLEEMLKTELLNNPVLEEKASDLNSDAAEEKFAEEDSRRQDEDDYENGYESELARQEEWSNELPLPGEVSAEDRKGEFISNSPAPAPTLRDVLMVEAEISDIPEKFKRPVLEIISSIDPDGFLTVPLADLVMSCMLDENAPEITLDDVETALKIVRNLAPEGVWIGRRSDFCKQQLRLSGRLTPEISALCDELETMPDFSGTADNGREVLAQLAANLNTSAAEVEKMLAVLSEVKFTSSLENDHRQVEYIQADFEFEMQPDGALSVNMFNEFQHRFTVSPLYEKMLEDKSLSPDDRKYLAGKISRARNMVKALDMRGSTLKRLAELVAAHQQEFFRSGVDGLKSFTMSEAAEILGHDVSTITRAVQNKFVRTPRGVLPLRFFFPGGPRNSSGQISQPAVMENIRQIIDGENPALPLSDEEIARQLNKKGIQIERRTVAKYRNSMNIPSASGRKHRM